MMKRRGGRQDELIPRSKRPVIPIDPSHQLAVLGDELNWDELLSLVEEIRARRVKSNAGRPPHLRALVGALLLKATRDLTFREAEDLIRYYAPARYMCGLTETEWSPDHNTVHDFEVLLGEEGVRLVNEYVVKLALKEKLTFSSLAVGDTTAQEAAIPYPNEMRLMAAFMSSVSAAGARAGKKLKQMLSDASEHFQRARETLREFRLFGKTRERRRRGVARMMGHVRAVQMKLKDTLEGLVPVYEAMGKSPSLACGSFTRRCRSSSRRFSTGTAPAGWPPRKSSASRCPSCTRCRGENGARTSSLVCSGALPGSRGASSLPTLPQTVESWPTLVTC